MQARGIVLDAPVEESTSTEASAEPLFDTTPAAAEPSVTDAVARWTLRAAAVLFPLAFLPNAVSEFVLPKLLLLRLVLAVLGILLLFRWYSQRAITWRRTPLDVPLLASLGSAALSTIFAVNRNVAIFGTYDRWEGLLTIASYLLLFWLAIQFLSSQSDARGLTWSLLSAGYVIGGAAILQSAGLLPSNFHDANGIIRAEVTLAQPDFSGIFLAMLLPVALLKLFSRRSATTRILAASIAVVIALGLVATYTRGAWIGAVIGCILVLTFRRGRFHLWPLLGGVGVAAATLALAIVIAGHQPAAAHPGYVQALVARVASITDPNSPAITARLRIWHDTPALIARRPIVGSGPDTFGLISWETQTSNRLLNYFDKPHMELLGIAATQGLIGLAAYLWILVTCARCFWRGRRLPGAVALFGGFVAYQVSLQADFSYIPAAIPFWLLVACAIVTWTPELRQIRVASFPRRLAGPTLALAGVVLAGLVIPAVALPYLADTNYYASLSAPTLESARATIGQARQLGPNESTYAVEAGNYALNLQANGLPAANADWQAARQAYETAADLGSFSPEMFQTLALVDEHLGDHSAALVAARHALELDRFDPTSQKLVKELSGLSS